MDNIIKEFSNIEVEQSELNRIQALKKSLSEAQEKHKEHLDKSFEHITTIFKDKLKNNSMFCKMVENYVHKYVPDDKKVEASEDLFNILASEMISMFNGLSHTTCAIM